jgi:AcrR family transcriptional regulator
MTDAALSPIATLRAAPVRQTRRKLTRERICVAAREIFLRVGYQAATMEQIAQDAEVGRSTLYTIFRDKDAILAAIADDYLAAIGPMISNMPAPQPTRAEIDHWIADFARFVRRERAPSLLLIQISLGKDAPASVRSFGDRVMLLYAERLPAFEAALSPANVSAWARASAALRELSWALVHHVEEDGSDRAAAMLEVAGDLFEKLIRGWDRQ